MCIRDRDYVGLSWVEFIPLLITVGLFITAYSIFKNDWRHLRDCEDYFLISLLSVLVSLAAALPLTASLCYGCLLPNLPDDIQCAAVIDASKDVMVIEYGEKTPKTRALIIKKSKGSEGFSVWKDNII